VPTDPPVELGGELDEKASHRVRPR
jgi:hypothetical protein